MKRNQFNQYCPAAFRAAGAGIAIAAMLAVSGVSARAGESLAVPFTAGNIVVEKFGDGTTPLGSAACPILFDEITTSGTLVQSFGVPSQGPNQIVDAGNANTDGGMSLSVDGKSLVFPGYATNVGVAGVTGISIQNLPRAIGRVDAYGNYTLPVTDLSGSSSGFTTLRGAASDGTNNYWGSGTGSTTNYGVYYFGSASPAADLYSANIRSIGIFNGNIYYSTASSTGLSYGIAEFTGLPTASATPTKIISLVSSNGTYNFSLSPAGTTLYYADDGDESTGGAGAGIVKWTNNGTSWSKAYYVATNACYGLLVNWATTPPTIYATTSNYNNSVIQVVDNGADSAATVLISTGSTNEWYRGLCWAPTNTAEASAAPVITAISPTNLIVSPGSNVTFTLFGNAGVPAATNQWYEVSGGVTNPIVGATNATLLLPNVVTSNTASYFAIAKNTYGSSTSGVASLTVIAKPTITAITPTSTTNIAGSTVTFTLTSTPGVPAATNLWYSIISGATNLIAGQTNTTLTLTNVLEASSGSYFAILTNSSGSATSAVATLTVIDDPNIQYGPASAFGLLGGTVQFTVGVGGTSPSYQWYFSDLNSNIIAPVAAGTQPSGSYALGTTSSTLTITNLRPTDPTNFLVVVTNVYGSVTSSVATLFSVSNTAVIAFWNFNQPVFTNLLTTPPAWYGAGIGAIANCFAESGQPDPSDQLPLSYIPLSGLGTTNYSWAMYNFPLNNATNSLVASNKQCGAEFFLSTAGARNIGISFDSRVTQTASYYERLQYTTNSGTNWIDYPCSSAFNGNDGSGDAGFYGFSFDLTGLPGADNNPDFGFRFVEEFQSTASYGVSANSNYVGAGPPEAYGFGGTDFSAGTLTFDLVTVTGDAITNAAPPPVIGSISNIYGFDYIGTNVNFTVTDGATDPGTLSYNAVALDSGTTVLYGVTLPTGDTPFGINPGFGFSGSGSNRTLTINPNTIPDEVDACPILITVTDPNTGASASTSFIITLQSVNLAPTNTLTSLPATNIMANSSITIPFAVSDDRTATAQLTNYTVGSDNNTLIPAGNIVITGSGTANPSVIITPAANQVGVAVITVSLNDDDSQEARTTTATIAVSVLPNTNVVAIDYFDYDSSGALELIGSNFWTHLSGNAKTLQYVSPTDMPLFGNGYAVVDTLDYTENLQARLLGAPYGTNSATVPVLYMSFLANMSTLPNNNGSYFMVFNDGSGNTADVECRVMAATNGAAAGYYRLGIANTAANATNAVMFPMDLAPNTNYTVVASLDLATGQSTIWVNPLSALSESVTDTSAESPLYNISAVEMRQGGANAGIIRVQKLKVGTTFDSVLPSLHVHASGANVVVSASDPTLGIQAATNAAGPYVNVSSSTPYTNSLGASATFYRFGQTNTPPPPN